MKVIDPILVLIAIIICSTLVSSSVSAEADPATHRRFGGKIGVRVGVPPGETFDSDGVKIHYTVEGEGEPVLLIHGFRANANMNWRAPGVTKMLAEEYKVIAIDNRGHGESDKPETEGMYGVKMVEDCLRLLDHLKIEKAYWVGYSMGEMITLKALAMHPDRIKAAVVGGMGWIEKRDENPVRTLEPNAPEEVGAFRLCARQFGELGISREELLAIKTPMTVVIGADDPLNARAVKPLQEARPDVPVVVVPEGTHLSCIMKPEFKSGIADWLRTQSEEK